MTDYQRLAATYLDVWNEADQGRRVRRIRELCQDDVGYVDPVVDVRGAEALAGVIGAAQQQFPGWSFRLDGPVDGHHGQFRLTWGLGPDGDPAPVVGFDVLVLDDDGRIGQVYGFLDRVPA